MTKRQILCLAFLLMLAVSAVGQTDSSSQQPDTGQTAGTPPAPAFGQDNAPPQSADNPPISGLDQPSLEPHIAARSFLIPGIHVSQSLDTNLANSTSTSSSIHGVTRVLGSLTLQRLWSRYDTAIDYVGGGAFYSSGNFGPAQFHSVDGEQRILWRNGQLAIRDTFSYLPEGVFGNGSYGGSGALGGTGGGIIGGIGGSGFFGPGQFAALGQSPRITNVSLADITQNLTPRSSVTVAGSYGIVHFTDNNTPFINSRQISAQVGYDYQINRKDQVAILYGFQEFRYPVSIEGDFTTHLWHVLYGHRISGRMDLVLGGGPQLTLINSPLFGNSSRLGVSGRASLRYRFKVASAALSYDRFNTSGSGFYGGASTDVARLTIDRPFHRVWTAAVDFGFTRNNRILPSAAGNFGQRFDYGYAGFSLHRQFGRDFTGLLSYQFNDLMFDASFCTVAPCSRTSQRHVLLIGVDWHPHPIRLD